MLTCVGYSLDSAAIVTLQIGTALVNLVPSEICVLCILTHVLSSLLYRKKISKKATLMTYVSCVEIRGYTANISKYLFVIFVPFFLVMFLRCFD